MNLYIDSTRLIIPSLGWTLLHFLWQGALFAAFFYLAQIFLRHRSAQSRYLAGCLAMLLLALAPLATFCALATRQPAPASTEPTAHERTLMPVDNSSSTTVVSLAAPSAIDTSPARAPERSLQQNMEPLFPWLVASWLLGVTVLALRLLAGWMRVQRFKRHCVLSVEKIWVERLEDIKTRLQISRPVALLQSALVEVPTVIGWLRPIILLPASTLTGLSPAQLESVLAHELAHVRRHDYLVNLLQSVIETVLFYHPAVWWISRSLREERENCCDDLAVAVCQDRLTYIRALATLEQARGVCNPALAATGGSLVKRVRRLLQTPQSDLNGSSWWLAGMLVAAMVLLFSLSLETATADSTPAETAKAGLAESPTNTVDVFQIRRVAEPGRSPAECDEMDEPSGGKLLVLKPVLLNQTAIAYARVQENPLASMQGQEPFQVYVTLTKEGSKAFAALTEANVGRRIAIIYKGKILLAPKIMSKIKGGKLVISGKYNKSELQEIAEILDQHRFVDNSTDVSFASVTHTNNTYSFTWRAQPKSPASCSILMFDWRYVFKPIDPQRNLTNDPFAYFREPAGHWGSLPAPQLHPEPLEFGINVTLQDGNITYESWKRRSANSFESDTKTRPQPTNSTLRVRYRGGKSVAQTDKLLELWEAIWIRDRKPIQSETLSLATSTAESPCPFADYNEAAQNAMERIPTNTVETIWLKKQP